MRCKLFVPGSRPELFAKAMAGEADMISIDLEDAVDESRKDWARGEVAKFLATLPADKAKTIVVRVNGVDTPHFEKDIEAISLPALDLVNQPMPQGADDVRHAAAVMTRIEKARGIAKPVGIMANIETPKAFRLAAEIASADKRVAGLVVLHFQLGVKLAAAEAGIWAFDSAMADVKNVAFLEEEAIQARKLGFLGKSAIHPSQVAVINRVFRPTDAEIAHSVKVVASAKEAAEKGVGAWVVDGKMIDAPFVARAEAVLRVARKLGLLADA